MITWLNRGAPGGLAGGPKTEEKLTQSQFTQPPYTQKS